MDFWDITKLLARRWMIVLPLLVICGALAVGAMSQVKPDYVATAHVQLVPPVLGATKPGEATADQRNPWIGLGLQTIGNAAIVTVTDLSVGKELHAQGYSDSYTLTMSQSSPLITFEIVGASPDQARRTADRLIARFDESVASLQTSYGVSTADSITSRRLDVGTNVEKSTSKVKRAFVAVAGAGLLVTVAATVGIDAWLRRRQRQRSAATPLPESRPGPAGSHPRASAVAAHANGDRRSEPYAVTMTSTANGSGSGVAVPASKDGSSSDLTQPIALPGPAQPVQASREAERPGAVPSDATIVLPRLRPQPLARPGQRE